MTHDRYNSPNLLTIVRTFMETAGQTTDKFNAQQTTLYVGLVLEEVAELLQAVGAGCVDMNERLAMLNNSITISRLADQFKSGRHTGDVMRSNHEEVLDALIDTAWVAIGGALSISTNAAGAVAEVGRANHDKFPGGVVIRDANGKVKKPANWRGPNLQPFVIDKESLK